MLQGTLRIDMRDGDVVLGPGEPFVSPKVWNPVPKLTIKPRGLPNTGDEATVAQKAVIWPTNDVTRRFVDRRDNRSSRRGRSSLKG